jgi:outer membrane protein TolC
VILLLVGLICRANTARAQPEAPQTVADKKAEIKTLLKERRDTLQKAVGLLVELYRRGAVDLRSIAQAEREALRATLEVDDGPEARLAALKKYHENAIAVLKFSEEGFKAGRSSQVEVLQAKAIMLEAKIELLREEVKAKPGK